MSSKVLVKIPAVNFNAQVGKCTSDLVSLNLSGAGSRGPPPENVSPAPSSPSESYHVSVSSDPSLRVTQLEQNIKFLKEQHHLMLTSLHHEVETLRQRNRDLQFQLVFNRGSLVLLKSTPSSPEDDSKPHVVLSPKQVNVTSLQVEILERDIAELRSSLTEARTRNSCLEKIIDEQKKLIETSAKSVATQEDLEVGTNSPDPDLVFKLEEAEKVIRRLRRENDEQRRELAMIKANQSKTQTSPTSGGGMANATHHRPANQWSQQPHRDPQREFHQQQREPHHHDQHREPYREQQRDQREQRHEQHRDVTHDSHYEQHEQARDAAREGSRFPPLTTPKFWHNNNGQRGRWWDSGRGAGGSRMLNQSLPSLPGLPLGSHSPNPSSNGNPSSAPFTLLSHGGGGGGGGRRAHRGNYRGDRSGAGRGANGSVQQGGRGHWDQNREHRGGRERDRHRDQGFHE